MLRKRYHEIMILKLMVGSNQFYYTIQLTIHGVWGKCEYKQSAILQQLVKQVLNVRFCFAKNNNPQFRQVKIRYLL